jgi:hypothetical protein
MCVGSSTSVHDLRTTTFACTVPPLEGIEPRGSGAISKLK